MPTFECFYCRTSFNEYNHAIEHYIVEHNNDILKINFIFFSKKRGKTTTVCKNYDIIPEDVFLKGKIILPNKENCSIRIQNIKQHLNSPLKKFLSLKWAEKNILLALCALKIIVFVEKK